MYTSVLRAAQIDRRWLAEDLATHRNGCLACSRESQPDCRTGAMLSQHLQRAELQLKMLKEPSPDQLDLGLPDD